MQYPLPSIKQPQPTYNKPVWNTQVGGGSLRNDGQNPIPWDDGFAKQDYLKNLLKYIYPGAIQDADWTSTVIGPQFRDTIQQMLAGTTTAGAQERARGMGQSIISNQTALGRRQAAIMGAQGASPALQQGVMENALNQGRTQANQIFAEESDPQKMLLKRLQMLMQGSNTPSIQMIQQFLSQAQNGPESQGLFDKLLNVGSSYVGALKQ